MPPGDGPSRLLAGIDPSIRHVFFCTTGQPGIREEEGVDGAEAQTRCGMVPDRSSSSKGAARVMPHGDRIMKLAHSIVIVTALAVSSAPAFAGGRGHGGMVFGNGGQAGTTNTMTGNGGRGGNAGISFGNGGQGGNAGTLFGTGGHGGNAGTSSGNGGQGGNAGTLSGNGGRGGNAAGLF